MLWSGSGCGGRAKTIIRLNERINGEIIPLFWPPSLPLHSALFTFLPPFLMAKMDGAHGPEWRVPLQQISYGGMQQITL